MNPAGFIARFFAWLIDGIALGVIVFILSLLFGAIIGIIAGSDSSLLSILSAAMAMLLMVTLMLLQFLYFGYYWSSSGQTFGMKMIGIKVVYRGNHGKIGFLRGALRGTLGYWLSGLIFGLGYIWAAFDDNKEAWHDKLFETWVVDARD